MRLLYLALALALSSIAAHAACSAGAPLLTFQLAVQPADVAKVPISVRSINRLVEGQKLIYSPIGFGANDDDDKGRIALVLVPAEPEHEIIVLDPQKARATAEWEVPFRTAVVALVYGPTGLSTKKVRQLVKKDQELVEQLADYAEQTAKTEKLLEALSAPGGGPDSAENLTAALRGFSSSYGRSGPQFNWNASKDQQAATLIRTLNPALSQYDPLAAAPQKRMQQSALLASSVAGMFFGTPVGLAAGGAGMAVNLTDMMFPGTSFRSAFVQEAPAKSLTLCSKRQKDQARTRYAYLWAVRVPDAGAPDLSLASVNHVPSGATSEIPVELANDRQWPALERISEWRLVNGDKSVPVRVSPIAERKTLRMRLGDEKVPAGTYKLAAKWDWDQFTSPGEIEVHEVSAEGKAVFARESLDRLVQNSGLVAATLEGCDFEFVNGLSLQRKGEDFSIASPVYRLPEGPAKGPQHSLEVTLDTDSLDAGEYVLAVQLPGDAKREVAFRVLPPHPELQGLPLRANLGENEQALQLRGTGLDRVTAVRGERGEFAMNGGGEVHVTLNPDVRKGERLNLELEVEGLSQPLPVENALEVIGPRPSIKGSRVSLPGNLGVELREGELPAGSFASFSLEVEPLDSQPVLDLACVQDNLGLQPRQAVVGQQSPDVRLRSAGAGTLFLSLDPGAIGRAGCHLDVKARTETEGSSDAFRLGTVVRLPSIGKFELSADEAGAGRYYATLEGEDLELIERVGWDSASGLLVEGLPVPVAAGGHSQTLKFALPWPSPAPHAPLYVWLRGESEGRLTAARY